MIDIFSTHEAIVVPPNEQQALSGDFDGDRVLVMTGQPCLYQHIEKQLQQAPPVWATKSLKTFTPAVNSAGGYQRGRMRQISSVVIGKVLQCFTTLQRTWLAVTRDRQQSVAELVIADSQIMQQVKKLSPRMAERVSIDPDSSIELVSNRLIQGINAGTDAFKADTAIVQFDALANSLQSLFSKQKLPCVIPYSKKYLTEKIAQDQLDPGAIREALRDNPNLAASTLCQGLAVWCPQQDTGTITKKRAADHIEGLGARVCRIRRCG